MKTSGHSSLEKYTSHFIWKGSKGLRRVLLCERWVGDWTELQHIDPDSYGHNSVSFPFSWAAQPGAWGPCLCWDMVLIPASSLQPIWTFCRRDYIIIWRPPTSCERYNSHSIQPLDSQGYLLISLTGCTCYLHRCISSSICNTCTIKFQKFWCQENFLCNFYFSFVVECFLTLKSVEMFEKNGSWWERERDWEELVDVIKSCIPSQWASAVSPWQHIVEHCHEAKFDLVEYQLHFA